MRAEFGFALLLGLGAAAAGAEQPAPDPELLEFLGSFTTKEGEWVDPLDLAVMDETAGKAAEEEAADEAREGDKPREVKDDEQDS